MFVAAEPSVIYTLSTVAMEFDAVLTSFQGLLYSLGASGELNKLESYESVVSAIKNFKLPDDSRSKVMFFMVLNSKLTFTEKLRDDENLGLFIGTIPPIEVLFLVEYAFDCNLLEDLFKVIENCPTALGRELIVPIKSKLEFELLQSFPIKSFSFWECLFKKIVKARKSNESCKEFIFVFRDMYFFIENFIIEMVRLKNVESAGHHLRLFLESVLHMVRLEKNLNTADDQIFKISIPIQSEVHLEEDTNCIAFVFDNLPRMLENLSLDMWINLSEISYTSSSFQAQIGYLVHCIIQETNECVPPELRNFEIDAETEMAEHNIEYVVLSVQKDPNQYFRALVRHSGFAEEKAVQCVMDFLYQADEDDLNVILNKSLECVFKNEGGTLMKKLFLKALKVSDWWRWADRIFQIYRPGLLTLPETHDEIVRTFNKISKEKNIPEWDLISLYFQSPEETVKKICEMVISTGQIEMSLDMLGLLKLSPEGPFSGGVTLLGNEVLGFLSEDFTEKGKRTFCDLVLRLSKENLLGSLFFNKLLRKLKVCLEQQKMDGAVLSLKLAERFLDLKLALFDKPAFLVFLCQVLECFSWDVRNFSPVKEEGREVTGRIVANILKELDDVSDVKFKWVRLEILKSLEVNQAHFCDLWFSSGLFWSGNKKFHVSILTLIHSRHKAEVARKYLLNFEENLELVASLILSLLAVLPVVSFREWSLIYDQLIILWREKSEEFHFEVLDMFASSLHAFISISHEMGEVYCHCHEYCLRNFSRLASQHLDKMDGKSSLKIFQKIFVILGKVEDELWRKSSWQVVSPLMFEFIDYMKKKEIVNRNKKLIERLLQVLDFKDLAKALEKRLE